MKRKISFKQSKITSKLYDHQKDALDIALAYIKSNSPNQALIKMPTGTGKTFVMGVLSCFVNGCDNVIVVSPSAAIRDQLYKEIKSAIWEKMNLSESHGKSVDKLFLSNVESLLEKEGKKVYVTTTHALSDIFKSPHFDNIKREIDLVLFDEGHREPAPGWSETIASFEKKTVLFTATPIRNDYRIFNIDNEYYYNYPIVDAIKNKIIKSIDFKLIDQDEQLGTKGRIYYFLDKIMDFRSEFMRKYKEDPKVIIRFNSYENIEIALQYMLRKKEKVIAIHDQFKKTRNDANRYQNVPMDNPAVYWIAQHKLIEGIDDNSFAIVGIFDPFKNVRSLIQQIGRTLRVNAESPVYQSWVVINADEDFQEDDWESYIQYEKSEMSKEFPNANFNEYFNKLLESQPEFHYDTKNFIKRFEYDTELPSFEEALKLYNIPLRVNIFHLKKGSTINLESLLTNIEKQKETSNEFFVRTHIHKEKNMVFVVYIKIKNSKILKRESFVEVDLGLFFIWQDKKNLFYFDTNNQVPSYIYDVAEKINSRELQNLFDVNTEFTEITLRNGMMGQNDIHRRVINSSNMNNIAPGFTDRYNLCTTIRGTVETNNQRSSRYIGFSNSRISDRKDWVIIKDYIEWIETLSEQISKREAENVHSIFNRYASIVNKPTETSPLLITLNQNLEDAVLIDRNDNESRLTIKNFSVKDNDFHLIIDDRKVSAKIEYNKDAEKYKIGFTNSSLDKKYKVKEEFNGYGITVAENTNLINYLNQTQDFQIVTSDGAHIYYRGEFFNCEIPLDLEPIENILSEYELIDGTEITTEKGDTSATNNEWSKDSLFYLMASVGSGLEKGEKLKKDLSEMDYLVCTDLGTEIADFVGVNADEKKVYFIHCKVIKAKRSASAFQDISAQIIKNLDYAHPLSSRKPPTIKDWDSDWTKEKVSRNRWIKSKRNIISSDFWDLIKDIQRKPESRTYVWALTGNMFSLKEYKEQKKKEDKQKPEIIQIDYLLGQVWASVQSVGAEFEVFFNKK